MTSSNRPNFHVSAGIDSYPKIILASPDGARAEVYLHGANIVSWIPAGGKEALFLSGMKKLAPDRSIRGGVPIIFPQFLDQGPLSRHGFARKVDWMFVNMEIGSSGATGIFELRDTPATRLEWDHAFQAIYTIHLNAQQLSLSLMVTNTGESEFSFSGALHTYLRVNDIHAVRVEGLSGLPYLDTTGEPVERVQAGEPLEICEFTDRTYFNAPSQVVVRENERSFKVEAQGFQDVVVWNPWREAGAKLDDLEPDGYLHMLCVEAAQIGAPVHLDPGQSWSGGQRILA